MMKQYDIRVQAQPAALFETPIVLARLQNAQPMLADLETAIRERMKNSVGLSRSNLGGWHSDTDMLHWGGEAARKLGQTATSIAKRMTFFRDAAVEDFDWAVQMWSNVLTKGGLNHLHAHPGNLWAAVLFLEPGTGSDSENNETVGGNFYLEDPRFPMIAMRNPGMRLRDGNGQPQELQPELILSRGDLIVFPAWLRHGVRPYEGDIERITVALNIDALSRH